MRQKSTELLDRVVNLQHFSVVRDRLECGANSKTNKQKNKQKNCWSMSWIHSPSVSSCRDRLDWANSQLICWSVSSIYSTPVSTETDSMVVPTVKKSLERVLNLQQVRFVRDWPECWSNSQKTAGACRDFTAGMSMSFETDSFAGPTVNELPDRVVNL